MKCQIHFSGINKENINLSSAEFAQREIKVKTIIYAVEFENLVNMTPTSNCQSI